MDDEIKREVTYHFEEAWAALRDLVQGEVELSEDPSDDFPPDTPDERIGESLEELRKLLVRAGLMDEMPAHVAGTEDLRHWWTRPRAAGRE